MQLVVLQSLTRVSWAIAKQRHYRYFLVTCILKSITRLITDDASKKNLVVNETSIPYILYTLKHVELSERAVYTELELF
jgi:hypothetical protein